MSSIKWTIRKKVFLSVLLSFAAGTLMFYLSLGATDYLNDRMMLEEAELHRLADSLQKYVTQKDLAATDQSELDSWRRKNRRPDLEIYAHGQLVYSTILDVSSQGQIIREGDRAKMASIPLQFRDGEADVLLYNFFQWHSAVLVLNVIIGLIVFVIVFYIIIRRYMERTARLQREVQNLEGGDLSQEITVEGNDEVAMLAESVESFREGMVEKLQTIRELEKANRQMSAEIAHDLRTPLTSLIMYLDFAHGEIEGKIPQAEKYLDKAKEKSVVLKNLIEKNFSFVAMDPGEREELLPVQATEVLGVILEDLTTYLRREGFRVRAELCYDQSSIWINKEAALRVFGNLVSNIKKYADRSGEIYIGCRKIERYLEIRLVNDVRVYEGEGPQSTGFGSKIILRLMDGMDGGYMAMERDGRYETILRFLLV